MTSGIYTPADDPKKLEDCPVCQLRWTYFPPVKIFGSQLVRCVECKSTFPIHKVAKSTWAEKDKSP